MKIIIVGSDKVWAIERYYHKYFNELGIHTDFFIAQSMFYDYYQKSLLNKIIFKSGLSSIYKKINKAFKKEITLAQPDAIFIFKGMEITPDTLKWLSFSRIKIISFNPDNPFVFTGSGSGNKNVTKSIGLYDLHFTYNTDVYKKLEKDYKIPVKFLPFGFELDDVLYHQSTNEEEINKVCFLGNPDKDRAIFIESLAENGIQVDIYGNDWKKFVSNKNITFFDPIYGDDFWKVLRKYRVQLNLMRIHNPDSHNMRTFEIPGVGGIMVAPDTEDHRNFFEAEKEIFLFTDVQSCIEKIKYLLQLHKNESDKIRNNARAKSLAAGYTYKNRSKQALKIIKELVDKEHAR